MPERNFQKFLQLGKGRSPSEDEDEEVVVEEDETASILDETAAGDNGGDAITFHPMGELAEASEKNDAGSNNVGLGAAADDVVGDQHVVIQEPGANVHYSYTDLHVKEPTKQVTDALTTTLTTPPPTPAITTNTLLSNNSSSPPPTISNSPTISNNPTISSSPTASPASHLQSLHQTLKAHSDHLKSLGSQLNTLDTTSVHKKSSLEKNGINAPEDRPRRWIPPEEEDTERAPQAPDGENEAGKIYCQSTEGKFGAKKGAVVLRYQYELSVAESDEFGLVEDILPNLEGGITDSLLPVFFGEECLDDLILEDGKRIGTGVERVGPLRGRRNLRGGYEREQQQHRRLSKVVGIDSEPKDFPLWDKACSTEAPLTNSQACHTMEGALTLYFPPNYSIHTLVQGAHLTTLNTLRQSMADGSIAKRSNHPGIVKLKFLESSYSLSYSIPPGLEVMDDTDGGKEPQKANVGGLVAGILIPLFLLLVCCCCGCCFLGWKRRGGTLDDLLAMVDPQSGSRRSPALTSGDGDEEDSLHKPKQPRKEKKKKEKKRRKAKKVKRSKRSKSGDRTVDGSQATNSDQSELDPIDEELMPGLNDSSFFDPKQRRRASRRSKKKKKKKGKSDKVNGNVPGSQSLRSSSSSNIHSSSSSPGTHGSQRSSVRSSQQSGTSTSSQQLRSSFGSRGRSATPRGGTTEFDIDNGGIDTDNTNTDTEDDANTFGNGTTTSSDSTDEHDSTTSSGSSSDDSSTTSSDRGTTTDGSTTTSSRGSTTRSGSKETTTSTSDNDSTTSSDDDNDSTTSSDDENEGGDQFDLGPSFHSNFMRERRGVRQRQARTRKQQQDGGGGGKAGKRSSKPSTTTNNNLIMTGVVEDDNMSVMTGMTGATGMHSVSSQATAQMNNTRVPMSIGGGDDMSVMTGATGVSGATRKVSNIGGGGGGGGGYVPKLPNDFGVRNDSNNPGGGPGGFGGATFAEF